MQATQAARQMIASEINDFDECDLTLPSGHMTSERPTRRVVPASACDIPDTFGLTSVFDLAFIPLPGPQCDSSKQAGPTTAAARLQDQIHTIITREPGVTRCQRQHYSETQDWLDQERARRARQRPPKPTAKAKTKSAKLVDLVGV